MLRHWCERFERETGEKYPAAFARDRRLLDDKVRLYGADRLKDLIDAFWLARGRMPPARRWAASVPGFVTAIPTLLADGAARRREEIPLG